MPSKSNSTLALKLFRPGQSLADIKAAFPALVCNEATNTEPIGCRYSRTAYRQASIEELDSIAEVTPQSWTLTFTPEEQLARVIIFLPSAAFERVRNALIAKYGKPTRSKLVDLSNGFGAKFQGQEHLWSRQDQTLSVTEYAGHRDHSDITLTSAKLMARVNSAQTAQALKAAKDL
jgi:hypothetical protein